MDTTNENAAFSSKQNNSRLVDVNQAADLTQQSNSTLELDGSEDSSRPGLFGNTPKSWKRMWIDLDCQKQLLFFQNYLKTRQQISILGFLLQPASIS